MHSLNHWWLAHHEETVPILASLNPGPYTTPAPYSTPICHLLLLMAPVQARPGCTALSLEGRERHVGCGIAPLQQPLYLQFARPHGLGYRTRANRMHRVYYASCAAGKWTFSQAHVP